MGILSLVVSLRDLNTTAFGVNHRVAPVISGSLPNVVASTGSSMLLVTGMYGKASASARLSLSGTSCMTTEWSSHSSLHCKIAWGVRAWLAMTASTAGVISNSTAPQPYYASSRVSDRFSFTNASLLNSSTCFFPNLTVCLHPQIVSFVSNASGFGAFPTGTKVFLEGSQCDDVTWSSDSALYCAYSHAISKALFTLQFVLMTTSAFDGPHASYVSVTNPLFVPNRYRLEVNTSLFATFHWPGDGVPSSDSIERYQRTGRASGTNMKPLRSLAAVAEFFEHFSVNVVVYINDTLNADLQIFMDSNFVPIAKTVVGKFSLFNESSGADLSAIFCRPQNITSITLLPEKYAAVATVEMSFCSPVDGRLSLVFNSSSSDEYGRAVPLPTDTISLVVRPPGPASVSVNLLSNSQFTVGNLLSASLHISYNAGSGLLCSRIRFEFVLTVECQSQIGQRSVAFKLSKSGAKSTHVHEIVMNCNMTLSDVWFVVPSSRCILSVRVPLAGLSATSVPFVVLPGNGTSCRLLGPRVNCESAGALIWSIYNASRRCLGVQLLDEEGNDANSTASAILAQARYSNKDIYALLNPSSYSIDSDGNILWCQLYSTNTSQMNVDVGVAVGSTVVWLAEGFNVTSVGPPAVLSAAPIANQSSIRLAPGQSPSINLTIGDAAGNAVVKIAKSFVIRIFVRVRRAVPASRSLLQSSEAAVSSICPSLTYINVSEGSPGLVSVSPPQLCTAGENDIFYAVGEMVGDSFVPSFNFELQTTVTVIPGLFETFAVNSPSPIYAQSYTLIKDVTIYFRDKGWNVVNGNARLSLQPTNSNVQVYPSHAFDVSSNGTASSNLPHFFVSATSRNFSVSGLLVHISIVGNLNSSSSNIVVINMTAVCLAGSRLSFPLGNSSLVFVYQALLAGQSVQCAYCAKPLYDSWLLDAPDCLTLNYAAAPVIVHSGKALKIENVTAMTDSGHVAAYATGWTVTMKLQRTGSNRSAVNAAVTLQQGLSQPITTVPAYTEEPASDYVWILQLLADHGSNYHVLNIMLPHQVSVLDFSPVSLRMAPSSLSYSGHASITVTGLFPSAASQRTSFSSTVLPALRNNSCLLKSSTSSQVINLEARVFNASTVDIIPFVCGPLVFSGSLRKNWVVSMLHADGRESAELSIQSYCPAGMYIETTAISSCAEPPCCLACPSPMSTSLESDSLGIQSCVCQVGFYGSGGLSCTACPKNVDGFKCSLSNKSQPVIQAGYYIDYSKLSSCSEYSPKCNAIVKCPNPAACPGTTEKECVKRDDECYDSEAFGCTACCPRYYIENFVCKPCPPSQLPLVLALCTLALILFAVFSSTFDFPPLVSVAQSLKLFLSSMQGFVSIRLLAISWPPIVLGMFDFTRYFTFNFNIIRPECTVDYTPQTKLVFVLIGPVACALFIIVLVVIYTVFKCRRISKMLQKDSLKSIHNKNFYETALSVSQCLVTTAFSLKFSNSRMMVDGAMWNALSPALAMRTNTLVLQQKVRRRTVIQNDSMGSASMPEDWIRMQEAVAEVHAEPEFASSAKRFRLLVASSLSIFVFTFQSCIESALSTFDCQTQNDVRFLRSNPKVKCSFDDSMYSSMITTTVIGLVMYCVLLPLITIITLRSRWCREVYVHDSVAYGHMFGFLTSMYSKACVLWELVACIRKVAFVAIPILLSSEALTQSVALFVFLIFYTFLVLRKQPMVSPVMNQIELLSCISVIVGCFSAIFFVIEYKGNLVLSGALRDLAGLLLVLLCAMCVLLSLRLMWNDFSSKTNQTLFNMDRFSKHCSITLSRAHAAAQR
jgi:hypothetical protein